MVPNPIRADIEALRDILSREKRFNFGNSHWGFSKLLSRLLDFA